MKDVRLVVLSGPSGAGKTTAIRALEDVGYFCVDNMPVGLLPKFMELLTQSAEITRAAVVVDVREREFLKEFLPVYRSIKAAGYEVSLIYLDASDEIIVRRFSETRRRHPLEEADNPLEGTLKERKILEELKAQADEVIDTTGITVHQLRSLIKERFSGPVTARKMRVNLVSFGFRYGVPVDAEMVLDVRFLPNPYFVDELRDLDGTDPRVRDFVLKNPLTEEFLTRLKVLLDFLLPLYWKEGKTYLTIAVGCTGGRHRSVVIAESLAGGLDTTHVTLRTRHRDVNRT